MDEYLKQPHSKKIQTVPLKRSVLKASFHNVLLQTTSDLLHGEIHLNQRVHFLLTNLNLISFGLLSAGPVNSSLTPKLSLEQHAWLCTGMNILCRFIFSGLVNRQRVCREVGTVRADFDLPRGNNYLPHSEQLCSLHSNATSVHQTDIMRRISCHVEMDWLNWRWL